MGDCIIDCCSLLNLYAGWAGLEQLRTFPHTWYICDAVLGESEFTREYGPDGQPCPVPLDLASCIASELLRSARPETPEEILDYVSFAEEIDDGEAQALAIAKHRGYVLLSDDRKARKIATRSEVQIATISTVDVLQQWQEHGRIESPDLRHVVQRISALARFTPRMGTAEFEWWRLHL